MNTTERATAAMARVKSRIAANGAATHCADCGGIKPAITPTEQTAIANGWRLEEFRAAVAQLTAVTPIAVGPADDDIPAAPDLRDRIRGVQPSKPLQDWRGREPAAAAVPPRPLPAALASGDDIPPAPDLHARILASAATAAGQPARMAPRPDVDGVPATPDLHDRIRAAAAAGTR